MATSLSAAFSHAICKLIPNIFFFREKLFVSAKNYVILY